METSARKRPADARFLTTRIVIVALGLLAASPACPVAAATSATRLFDNPGGGRILTATFGHLPLGSATAAILGAVHAELGSRPSVVQIVHNDAQHTVALIFRDTHGGIAYTGMSIVTAVPGAQAGGVAIFDQTRRFGTTYKAMIARVASITTNGTGGTVAMAAAEPLTTHAFADGTGSIAVPADWTVIRGGGGSALAKGPGGELVGYNLDTGALDPTNQVGQNYLRSLPPQLHESFTQRTAILPYASDPVRAWTTLTDQLARQNGRRPSNFVASKVIATSSTTAQIIGTANGGAQTYIAYVQVSPPNTMGQWNMFDTFVIMKQSSVAPQGATAAAVLQSVRINFGAFAAQNAAIRSMFQKQFESMIASAKEADAARRDSTDQALANDRATQEQMHKQAVSWENFSLDRQVVVDRYNGVHSTVDSDFADMLTSDLNFRKVPANELLRGVDY